MLIRAIFIRPDGELIRESVCACVNLINCWLIEEHVLKSNRGSTRTLTDSTRKQHKKEDSALCKNKKKDVIPTYSIFQHIYGKHNLVFFLRPNSILTVELHRSFLNIIFFSGKTLGDISFKLET